MEGLKHLCMQDSKEKPLHVYEYYMLYDLYSTVKTCCQDFFYLKFI